MIRVEIPGHLRTLAKVEGELTFDLGPAPTIGAVLDAIEERHPVLRGTIRDHGTLKRRAFVRYYACKKDLSHEPADFPLPAAVVRGEEPFLVVGSIAGG